MSVALMLLCRRSTHALTLLRPSQCTSLRDLCKYSTMKSKYPSLKASGTSPISSAFRPPADDKSRRLKLQEQMAFRERYQVETDMELIYSIPRYRLYSMMHFLCTIATVSIGTFMLVYYYKEYFDLPALSANRHEALPEWSIYAVGTLVCVMFGSLLVFIARMPTRVYHSAPRRAYTLFYHPMISVFRQRKVLFNDNQYEVVPQKLDNISGPERSVKIHVELGKSFFSLKRDFYLVENFFRSRKDIRQLRTHQTETNEPKRDQVEENEDIWETVVENQGQASPPNRSAGSSRMNSMR